MTPIIPYIIPVSISFPTFFSIGDSPVLRRDIRSLGYSLGEFEYVRFGSKASLAA